MYGKPVIRHEILKKTHAPETRLEHGRGRLWQSRQSRDRRARCGSSAPPGAPHREVSRKRLKTTSKRSRGALTRDHQQYLTCIYAPVPTTRMVYQGKQVQKSLSSPNTSLVPGAVSFCALHPTFFVFSPSSSRYGYSSGYDLRENV